MTSFPPRLHVLLAQSAEVGVILRRGPSKSVCCIAWDRRKDRFTVGQWLRGRIYERRSDLSPDGKYLIYFAMNGRSRSPTGGSWTAISRAPYLKAVVLFGKGDCWHGGGLFTGPRRYWLNDGYGHRPLTLSSEVQRDLDYRPAANYGGECPHPYYQRLQRDGWTLRQDRSERGRDVFEKPLPHGWLLRKQAHAQLAKDPGKGCYWDSHELEHPASGQQIDGAKWEWADLDSRRLVYAEGGGLYELQLSSRGPTSPTLLADFSGLQFEAIKAPY
jgi:hypothetical protein